MKTLDLATPKQIFMSILAAFRTLGLLFLVTLAASSPLRAQETTTTAAQSATTAAATSGTADPNAMHDTMMSAFKLRPAIQSLASRIPELPGAILARLQAQDPGGSLGWFWQALVILGLSALGGYGARIMIRRWGRKQFAILRQRHSFNYRTQRIAFLMARGILMMFEVAGVVIVAAVLALIFVGDHQASRATLAYGIAALAAVDIARALYLNILAPDIPQMRVFALDDRAANGLYRMNMTFAVFLIGMVAIILWMSELSLDRDFIKMLTIITALGAVIIASGISIRYRHDIGGVIVSAFRKPPALIRLLGRTWHVLAVVYFVVAFVVSSVRLLLDDPFSRGLVSAPVEAALVAIILYGLLLLINARILPRLDSDGRREALTEAMEVVQASEGVPIDIEATRAQAHAEAIDQESAREPFRDLLDHGAGIITFVFALWYLLWVWGVPLMDDRNLISRASEILVTGFIAYMAYRAVQIAVTRQLTGEPSGHISMEEAEMIGVGESRIATLLPIFRNFLLITIVVIAGMLILSSLGINIAPIFAGAGVVGLAVGFGAQTLIRDIFSGAFYLIDDAFRKGEYIDIGSAKGTVEKISIRSMQLRHHRGALTTVPFGEIQNVQNQSRDWAIMKLAFRVTYDTDTEKMRKIIKKFGQDLQADPYYGPMILEPPKSQGIMSMEDSGMIARVKFMTKPGKQFELRKVVYAGLQDLLQKNGIVFANQQVVVRVANPDGSVIQNPTPQQIAAGGVAAVLEEKMMGEA